MAHWGEADTDRLMEIMKAAFDPHWGEAWTRKQIEDALLFPGTFYRLADADGFVLSRFVAGEEELLLIGVTPAKRGRGIGAALLERLFDDARERGAVRLFLEMRQNNPAVSLYERCGFTRIGHRPRYYTTSDGSRLDAITYAKSL